VLHLQLEQVGVGEDVAAAAEDAVGGVFVQGGVEQAVDLVILVGGKGGHVFLQGAARLWRWKPSRQGSRRG
jgi:hypothetical protein